MRLPKKIKSIVIAWLLAGFTLLTMLAGMMNWADALIKVSIGGAFVLPLVYLNYWWLLPKYYEQGKGRDYILLSLALIVLTLVPRFWLDQHFVKEQAFFLGGMTEDLLRKRTFLAMLLMHCSVYVLTITFYLVRAKDAASKSEAELKSHLLETELKYLKMQLNPHFLFNTLNNIYSLSYMNQAEAAPMIMRLSECMRYLLHDGDKPTVPLSSEVSFLKQFVALNALRSPNFKRAVFEGEPCPEHWEMSPLLLLPLVENAFKHGDLAQNPNGSLAFRLWSEGNTLHFSATNSFQNIQEALPSGIGLPNVEKRLALLYPNRHRLSFRQEDGIFEASLQIEMAP